MALIDTGHSNINRQPDISPTYWSEVSGMAATAWDPGFIYMSGGAYAVTDLNAWSKCYDIYSECAQPPSKLNTRSEMTAGDNCAGVITSTGGVYKYILTSIETQTGSMEFPTTDAHLSIGAARPVANTSALYMEISNGNPTSIHANALGPFCSIKFNQSSDAGVAALIAYSGGARYLNFYPGNTLVMQMQETLGVLPGANNTFDLGTSGTTWKDIYATLSAGAGNKALRWNTGGKFTYVDTLIFSAGWGNLISGTYPNIIIGADSSLLATKLYVKHYNDSIKATILSSIRDTVWALTQSFRLGTSATRTIDVTLSNVTGFSATVLNGATYTFEAKLYTTSNVAGGVNYAIGGTATASSIIYEGLTTDAGLTTQSRGTAMAASVGNVTAVTAAYTVITGTIVCNATGSLTLQFAQNASNASASTILAGSTFIVTRIN